MAGIANGLAAYNKGTIIPITSTFFMFYLYAAPAVRMGALQHLQCIHVATHDSIGTGEDGPTHQPIELAALYRAMPNLLYLRPGTSEEVAGAWTIAIEARNTPSIISLSRQALPQLAETSRDKVKYGAYVLREREDAELTIIGVGAELSFAMEVADALAAAPKPRIARVVSFPCQRLFNQQPKSYQRQALRREKIPAITIEAFSSNGWERYSDAAICMKSFGKSLPGKDAYKYFGFETSQMAAKATDFLDRFQKGDVGRGEFEEL